MMKGFEDIELVWGDNTYTVPASAQMELIMRVEDGLVRGRPVQAYEVLASGVVPPIGQLASVFADAIRYAGGAVPGPEVYKALVASMGSDGSLIVDVMRQLSNVLGLLASDEASEEKDAKPAKKSKAPAG